jgi:hypothetical protein
VSDQEEVGELREVFASFDPMQVQMARDFLDAGGIETFVFDGQASRMLGNTSAIATRLMVYADDASEALERLKELGFAE